MLLTELDGLFCITPLKKRNDVKKPYFQTEVE